MSVNPYRNKVFHLTTHWDILSRLFISWQENFAEDMICIKRIGLAWWYTTLSTCEGVMWRVLAKNDRYNCHKPDVTTCIHSSVKQSPPFSFWFEFTTGLYESPYNGIPTGLTNFVRYAGKYVYKLSIIFSLSDVYTLDLHVHVE